MLQFSFTAFWKQTLCVGRLTNGLRIASHNAVYRIELQSPASDVGDVKAFWVSSLSSAAEQRRLFAMHFVLRGSRCVGCDIVQADHAPEAGVAQGVFHGILVRHQGKHQEEVEEELEEEVERDKEEGDQTTTCTCMDGMR